MATKTPSALLYRTVGSALFYRTLLLRAMTLGKAKWEPFADGQRGEIWLEGMRYSTELDETGCPLVREHVAGVLYKAVGGFPMPPPRGASRG